MKWMKLNSRKKPQRGVALIMVLGALTILTVMLTEFQDESSAELGSVVATRDALKAEYAARSAVHLSRLLIAAEPTIRSALAPVFMMMRKGPPQVPVWEFADQILGAFNDQAGTEAFQALAGVAVAEGKNLGMSGAGFELKIVDEDSKINVNVAARGAAFAKTRLAAQILGLISGPQYDALFDGQDDEGQFNDRQTICGALIDWTDSDEEAYVCDPFSGQVRRGGAEDSYYQLQDRPYPRKNAAFDSLEELHLVRGINEDFWSTFIDPDPDAPQKRVVTTWGQGKVNINTAPAQTLLAIICSGAPASELCVDPIQSRQFLTAVTMVRSFTAGAPLFSSEKSFLSALRGKGMLGTVLKALQVPPVKFLSESEIAKVLTTKSQVFSIYATGKATSGRHETRVRVHAVVDFQGSPLLSAKRTGSATDAKGDPEDDSGPAARTTTDVAEEAILAALEPNPAGEIVYFRLE